MPISTTNDHGTLYMVDREEEQFLMMWDIPEHLETRC